MPEKYDEKTILDIFSLNALNPGVDELEAGHFCLEMFEDIEETMKDLGIHIMLNLYEGADIYITENKLNIRMCLNILIYYFIRRVPNLKTFVISIEEHDHRVWITFYGEGKDLPGKAENQHSVNDKNIDHAMEITQQYMQERNICPMVIFNETIWKLDLNLLIGERTYDIGSQECKLSL